MITRNMILVTILYLASTVIYAQKINPDEYKKEITELELRKGELRIEKESLQKEIAEMTAKVLELENAYLEAFPKYLIKKYGKTDGNNLAVGRIWKGMKKEMMVDIWGKPDKEHTDRFSYGVFTQYYYGKITYFFRDGKLTDWEEVE